MKNIERHKGFTLLEILLVVAAISILAGIVIIAINPVKQLGDTRNAQRRSDVNTILNAVGQYSIDNKGSLPTAIDASVSTYQVVGTATTGCNTTCGAQTTETACVDLTSDLVPDYIATIPFDPQSTATITNTDYYINKSDNHITVGVCDPEQSAVIEVTR